MYMYLTGILQVSYIGFHEVLRSIMCFVVRSTAVSDLDGSWCRIRLGDNFLTKYRLLPLSPLRLDHVTDPR